MSDCPTEDKNFTRRSFLCRGLAWAAGAPLLAPHPWRALAAAERTSEPVPAPSSRSDSKVAIARCRSYGPEVREALAKCFDLLGGIGSLVKNKTVTVKINLTGTNFSPFLGRPVGETYMTHYSTALALGSLLFGAGARRVRFSESTNSRSELTASLGFADWDLGALKALGSVEFENTRNLGSGRKYAHLPVPGAGRMFTSFEFNHAYGETDVMVSLAKLKTHLTAGVTLSMKNLFGITPNALYAEDGGTEDALGGRLTLHTPQEGRWKKFPGLKPGIDSVDPTWRIPRVVTDICAARPIHLAIIDGITSMSGGEGPWCAESELVKFTTPGLLIAGLNPVSTDAVGTAAMGFDNPRAPRGTRPFHFCDNHILLAEQAGLGVADLARIDLRGLPLAEARRAEQRKPGP